MSEVSAIDLEKSIHLDAGIDSYTRRMVIYLSRLAKTLGYEVNPTGELAMDVLNAIPNEVLLTYALEAVEGHKAVKFENQDNVIMATALPHCNILEYPPVAHEEHEELTFSDATTYLIVPNQRTDKGVMWLSEDAYKPVLNDSSLWNELVAGWVAMARTRSGELAIYKQILSSDSLKLITFPTATAPEGEKVEDAIILALPIYHNLVYTVSIVNRRVINRRFIDLDKE